MLGKTEIDAIGQLIARYTAPLGDGKQPDGYFRLDAGPDSRRAKTVISGINWHGDSKALQDEVVDAIEGEIEHWPHLWLRVMPRGAQHPRKSLYIPGNPDSGNEADNSLAPKGPYAKDEGLAAVALGILRQNGDLVARNEQLHNERLRLGVEGSIALYETQHPPQIGGGADELLKAAIRDNAPRLLELIPEILRIGASWHLGQVPPPPPPAPPPPPPGAATEPPPGEQADQEEQAPEDPVSAVGQHVDAIIARAQAISAIAATTPGLRERAGAHLARLEVVVLQAATIVGLRVVPDEPPPPPAPSSEAA